MSTLAQDLKYAIRTLRATPAFTLPVILVLALGIGATTAIFSLVDATLMRPLPYRDAERVAMIWEDASFIGFPRNTPSPANYFDWKTETRTFADMAATVSVARNLTGDGEPMALEGIRATANLTTVLGIDPMLGRFFTAAEDQPGGQPVAVVSHGLWRQRFGGDPTILGRDIRLNGVPHTVVGVMGPGMTYPRTDVSVWVPMAFSEAEASRRRSHYLNVVGRLADGVTIEEAAADMDRVAAALEAAYPDSNTNVGAVVIPLQDHYMGDVRSGFLLLLAAVGAVLLIACANIANLLLVRSAGRSREIAVRAALGASRLRLVRQTLTESILLALAGGIGGLVFAWWSFRFLGALIPDPVAGAVALQVDLRVLGVGLAVSLVTGIVFGIAPALSASDVRLSETIQAGGRVGPRSATRRFRDGLVVAEIALSVALLIGAGLLIRSFASVRAIDPGYDPEGVLTVRMDLSATKYDDEPERLRAFYYDVLERVRALPGVRSAGFVSFLPLTNRGGSQGFDIEGRPAPPPGSPSDANYRVVTPDYLPAMGIPIVRGRGIEAGDTASAPPVAVINETLARQFFPGEDPIGKRIGGFSDAEWVTIVGIAGDVRQMGLEVPTRAQLYVPIDQDLDFSFFSPRNLAIRASGGPMTLAGPVREAVREVDPDQPVEEVRLLGTFLDDEVFQRRTQSVLLGALAALALIVATLGIYGVLSYAVAQLTREIGIRMALGAGRGAVMGMILRQGMVLAGIGCAVGVALAWALGGVISSMLFGVGSLDPLTFAGVPLGLFAVALAASLLPARRATRIDPIVALRQE